MEWRDGKAAKLKLRDHSVHAVKSWATPTSRDWKDGSATDKAPTNCQLGRQALRSMIDGDMSKLTLNPKVHAMADGMANRVDRIRACGNGVVPLVAAYAPEFAYC